MKKLLSCAFIAIFILSTACKKAEEPKSTVKEAGEPQAKKRLKQRNRAGGGKGSFLEVYNEQKLVSSVPADEFRTMATSKIKVGESEFNAVLLKDLLAKNNLQGKFVVLSNPAKSASLTWEQATKDPVYIYTGVKPFLLVHTTASDLVNVKFPSKLSRITVSATAAPAPAPKADKRAKKRKRK